jgi:LPS sulfotransferase NodH
MAPGESDGGCDVRSRSTAMRDLSEARDRGNTAIIRNLMDARLDFSGSHPLRKSYVVAASYRCGSTYLCTRLWNTGVLGAPAEYLNVGGGRMLRHVMERRLQAASPEDYFVKLLACRTSGNGVFGMKAHYHHFERALDWCPQMLQLLAPVTYIYLSRRDAIAQAVSMAKAIQTNRWTSMDDDAATVLRYDERLIGQCLEEIQQQKIGWLRWFELNAITPFVMNYEDLIANTASGIGSVIKLLDVGDDEGCELYPPLVEKLGDGINAEWAARFRREALRASSWRRSPSASLEWMLDI